MAINEILADSNPFVNYYGMATKVISGTIPEIVEVPTNDIDPCSIGSFYKEIVFGSNTNDWWKNDQTRVTFRRYISADTVDIELYKDNVKIADLDALSTLGTFTNGWTTSITEQSMYVSFLLDWKTVLLTHGWGDYQIKAQLNIVSNISEWESVPYLLLSYTDVRANKTSRIEWYADGKINGSLFDYTGLNLYHSRRLKAEFLEVTPTLEVTKYKTNISEWRQIQDKVIENYELRTKALPYEVTNNLTKVISLANTILITDYQIKAETLFRRISVYPDNFEKTILEGNTNSIYNIKFVAKQENNIKRNY
jgi:hypothetical protein